jgi:hypothetical protein
MKRREFISLAGAAVALAPVLTACGEDGPEQPKLSLANDELLAYYAVGLAVLVRMGVISAREMV